MRVVLGRTLGPGDLGIVSTVWSLVTMLAIVAIVGVTPTVTRFLALYLQRDDCASARPLLVESFVWVLLIAGGLAMLAAGFAPAISARWLGSPDFATLVRMGAMAVPAWALLLWLVAVFRGLSETAPSVFTKDISQAVLIFGFLALLWWRSSLDVANAVFFLYVIPAAAACSIGVLLLWSRIKGILSSPDYHAERREWVHFAWPLSLSMFLQNTTGRSIDILVLGYLATAADVGLYVSALSLVGLLGLVLQGVNYLALPMFTGSTGHARSRSMRQTRMLTFELTLPVTLVLILWPGTLTHLTFGDAFTEAVLAIPVLTVGYAVSNFFGPVGQLLLAEGRTRWHLLADLVSIGVFLVLAFVLIPVWSVLGAATARSLSQAAFNITAYAPFRKQSRLLSARFWLDIGGVVSIMGVIKILTVAFIYTKTAEIVAIIFLVGGIFLSYLWIAFRWRSLLLRIERRK
ncbi:MAG: hypothetical protein Kow0080_32120 [Candidatus Promineifilaceae bacterium]